MRLSEAGVTAWGWRGWVLGTELAGACCPHSW